VITPDVVTGITQAIPDAPAMEVDARAIPAAETQEAVDTPDGIQDALATTQPEYIAELPTGEKFRTVEELVAAKLEASRYIQDLHSKLRQPVQQQAIPTAPEQDPALAAIIADEERKLWAKHPNETRDAIRAAAEERAELIYEAEQRALKQFQRVSHQSSVNEFVQQHPYLQNQFGLEVDAKYRPSTPQMHLQLMKAEAMDRGIPWQQVVGTPTPPSRTTLPPQVQTIVERQAQQTAALRTPGNGVAATPPSASNAEVEARLADYRRQNPRADESRVAKARVAIERTIAQRNAAKQQAVR
jgi:hypothetical protein